MEKFIKKYIHKKTGATYTVTSPELEEYFSRNTSEYTSEDEILKGKKTSSNGKNTKKDGKKVEKDETTDKVEDPEATDDVDNPETSGN